jgi:hypothetical protein
MENLKNKKIEFSKDIEKAKGFFEEATGERINENPDIHFYSAFEKKARGTAGLQEGNKIKLPRELLRFNRITEFTLYHEFLHWTITKLGLREKFDENLNNYKLALPLRFSLVREVIENNIITIKNFIEEGTADLFAATLISKNENEILKNIFLLHFSPEPIDIDRIAYDVISEIRLSLATVEVYNTFRQIKGFTIDELMEIVNKNSIIRVDNEKIVYISPSSILSKYVEDIPHIKRMVNKCKEILQKDDEEEVIPTVGKITVLFAYEIYKKEGKDVKQLLRDLVFSPLYVVEKVVGEIQRDEDKKLLKNAIYKLLPTLESVNKLRDKGVLEKKEVQLLETVRDILSKNKENHKN